MTQETYLLHATVRDNLLHARPDATDAELEAACRAARIHDVLAALPEGYDTMVGSRGHRFSGGEKQRLAIARTLLRNPRVLVLDEATSALDNETERAVQAALDDLSHGRTTITIAHRLSTVRDADQIAVLDHGRVVELGTHEELLLRGGRYADLVRSGLDARRRLGWRAWSASWTRATGSRSWWPAPPRTSTSSWACSPRAWCRSRSTHGSRATSASGSSPGSNRGSSWATRRP